MTEESSDVAAEMPAFDQIEGSARIAVLGAGSWGTALAALLAANGHSVRLWGRDTTLVRSLQERHENARYLPDILLPEGVFPTADLQEALEGAQVAVLAVPSSAAREVAQAAAPLLASYRLLLSAAKGLEDPTGLRVSQVLEEVIPDAGGRIVVLSGPNLAVEVARGIPTAGVAASRNPNASQAIQRLFQAQPTFRVYTGRDVAGVELGGAIKNVIAIGAGVSDGLGFGDNSKAALMTRGLAEAIRLGVAQGAQMATFLGLSGVGDLMATGASRLSRNYRVGYALGQGQILPDILAQLGQVAEGVPTTHVLFELAGRSGVEMPLCEALHSILFTHRPASEVIRELLLRPAGEE